MPASIPHDTLVANLGRHISLSEDELGLFCARLRPHKVKRREFLLRQGEIARDSAFVVSGCMKAYATDTTSSASPPPDGG
jgi:CRP-like cAMP-binding protein